MAVLQTIDRELNEYMNITGKTKLVGLLGNPVKHSISPLMHNEAFRQLDMDLIYLAFEVENGNLEKAVQGLKSLGAIGWNVTMPYKKEICEYLDELSPAARVARSVNTVINKNGKLVGETTDGIGFIRSIEEAGVSISGKKMTLMGAGGAAISVLVQSALDGAREISVFNRKGKSYDNLKEILPEISRVSGCTLNLFEYDEQNLAREINDSDILVNGTPIGMEPDTEKSPIVDVSIFHKDLFVYDMIYNPEETMLIKQAKNAGCSTMNGLHMLLYQGAAAFELWTGEQMPVEIVKEKYFKR